MKTEILIIFSFILMTAALFGGAVLAVDELGAKDCAAGWEGTAKVEFSIIGGCRVLVDGQMVPSQNVIIYRAEGKNE